MSEKKRIDLTKTGKYFDLPHLDLASKIQKDVGKLDPMVVDYLDEFIEKLIEQLVSDCIRWGNTWLIRPKDGQELRTKDRYTDYFDMFEQAGTPVPWMKIVGGALICWIRDNHPELCIDANECEDVGKPELKPAGSIEEYVKDQHRPIGIPASVGYPVIYANESDVIGIKVSPEGVEDIVDPTSPDGKAGKEFGKALQETTDKTIIGAFGEGRSQSNPVAHVVGEILTDWKTGILRYAPSIYAPKYMDGKLIRESIVFTTGSMGKKIVLARCDKDGFIARGLEDMWIEGTVDGNGKYVISKRCGFDVRVNYILFVSYDHEYTLPRD